VFYVIFLHIVEYLFSNYVVFDLCIDNNETMIYISLHALGILLIIIDIVMWLRI